MIQKSVLFLLIFSFSWSIFAQPPSSPVCNPITCRGTFCCDSSGKCAIDEDSCANSICSVNCRNGCCVDNNSRCGTQHECNTFPFLIVVLSIAGFLILLTIIGLYKVKRNRREARIRIIPIGRMPIAFTNLGIIQTGTVVNTRMNTNGSSFNPPIKEAEVQPFQQQDINMVSSPMAQPYTIMNGQLINYDQIEYGVSSPVSSTSPVMDLKSNT